MIDYELFAYKCVIAISNCHMITFFFQSNVHRVSEHFNYKTISISVNRISGDYMYVKRTSIIDIIDIFLTVNTL